MKPGRILIVLTVAVVAAGTAVVLGETPIQRPAFIDRIEYPLDYGGLVRAHAARNRLDSALVAAVIYEESRFRPRALSKVGAMGLMQIQPVTGETIAQRTGGTGFRVTDLYDPDINIRYGACASSSTSTATSGWRWRPTTPERPRSTAGWSRGEASRLRTSCPT